MSKSVYKIVDCIPLHNLCGYKVSFKLAKHITRLLNGNLKGLEEYKESIFSSRNSYYYDKSDINKYVVFERPEKFFSREIRYFLADSTQDIKLIRERDSSIFIQDLLDDLIKNHKK